MFISTRTLKTETEVGAEGQRDLLQGEQWDVFLFTA